MKVIYSSLFIALCASAPCYSTDLAEDFRSAERADLQFSAAGAERDAARAAADAAIVSVLPHASYNLSNYSTEGGARQVVSVTQPLFGLDRFATLRQRDPRRRLAEADYATSKRELAQRLLRIATEIVRINESLRLNQARIDALGRQEEGARRKFASGLGTLTDSRDIAVRFEQARANQLVLTAELDATLQRYQAMVGHAVEATSFRLSKEASTPQLEDLEQLHERQKRLLPAIASARLQEQLAGLEARRVRGSMWPSLAATASWSSAGNTNFSYVGIGISAPLSGGSWFATKGADASARRATHLRAATEERARLDLDRVYSLVRTGVQAVAIQDNAVKAAELSVLANQRSFEGGVRTNVDVLNSIQVLYEVQNQRVSAITALAENLLSMMILSGSGPEDALDIVGRRLFGAHD